MSSNGVSRSSLWPQHRQKSQSGGPFHSQNCNAPALVAVRLTVFGISRRIDYELGRFGAFLLVFRQLLFSQAVMEGKGLESSFALCMTIRIAIGERRIVLDEMGE